MAHFKLIVVCSFCIGHPVEPSWSLAVYSCTATYTTTSLGSTFSQLQQDQTYFCVGACGPWLVPPQLSGFSPGICTSRRYFPWHLWHSITPLPLGHWGCRSLNMWCGCWICTLCWWWSAWTQNGHWDRRFTPGSSHCCWYGKAARPSELSQHINDFPIMSVPTPSSWGEAETAQGPRVEK